MPSRSPLGDAIVALILAAGFLGYAAKAPPRPVPATAPDSVFSAERAMVHVREMARQPHPPGTAEHARVRDYVRSRLEAAGLTAEIQRTTAVGTRFQEAGRIENVVARLPGRTPGGPAIMLVAHYDGVGAGPAAGDDASGSSVLLESLRALQAGAPLDHDVIFLFTDGEEAGLLGAAAFVAEHRWAKDVALVINFEARGTGGAATMFQTGPDNLDQLRILRHAPEVAASSVAVTVYQFLPNDTDLSELFQLGTPALNFAFADGVERYHTSEDDAEHLDPGSIQQEGAAALAVVRTVGHGALPRPATGNAVFFTLPLVGLVVYPEGWTRPLAVVAVVLTLVAIVAVRRRERRWIRGIILGLLALVVATGAGGLAAWAAGRGVPDAVAAPGVRGRYAIGIALLGLGAALLAWAIVRRWVTSAAAVLGPLVLWTGLAVAASWRLPGVSFLVLWPAMFAAVAAIAHGRAQPVATVFLGRWLPTVVTGFLIVPIVYGMGIVALGIRGPGGLAIGVLTPFTAWLLVPALDRIAADRPWRRALVVTAAGLLAVAVGRRSARHAALPEPSLVAYAQNADSTDAWLVTAAGFARPGSWNATAVGTGAVRVSPDSAPVPGAPPHWLTGIGGGRFAVVAAAAPRVALDPPVATITADSTSAEGRRVRLSIRAAPGTTSLLLRVTDGRVLSAWIDGRAVDTTRYRFRTPDWQVTYWAPPADSGLTLELLLPAEAPAALEMVASSPGLPVLPGVTIPPRPAGVLPIQSGDVALIRRRLRL